jgi:hypothetical protein
MDKEFLISHVSFIYGLQFFIIFMSLFSEEVPHLP